MSAFNIFKRSDKKNQQTAPVEFIIAGLGNPGPGYEDTRHNCGFMAVETLAEKYGVQLKRLKFKSLTAEAQIGEVRCLLMKPVTFMNNSGNALEEAVRFYKLPPEKVLVIYDDIALDIGRIRVRTKGSDGGHNGMKSIILSLDSDAFPRIRIGAGKKPDPDCDLADWVLSRFTKEEGEKLEEAFNKAVRAAELVVQEKAGEAMNLFNGSVD